MHNRLFLALFSLLAACGGSSSTSPEHKDPVHEAPAPGSPEAPSPAAPAAGASKLALSGTISFEGTSNAGALFVSIKDPTRPGPPLAAKKLPPGPFPMSFTLTDADIVQMGPAPRVIPDTVALSVTLDGDGNAMTKEPTDPKATLETPAEKSDLAITLTVAP